MQPAIDLGPAREALDRVDGIRAVGQVVRVTGLTVEAEGLAPRVGDICIIETGKGDPIRCEAVGFRGPALLLHPLGSLQGVRVGARVWTAGWSFSAPCGEGVLGRVIDPSGDPMDGRGPLGRHSRRSIYAPSPNPLTRQRITQVMETGIRSIDALLTLGRGQRIGIFAGAGVGKSTALGMIARFASSDVNVIVLIGERGREVREFLERELGPEGLARSVVVVSLSDAPALARVRAAWVATTIAEWFRDAGRDVLFLMDSLTRFAMAQREIGLALGEPSAAKGYTPSVFALLPQLLERAGAGAVGTVTGVYTVLVEGDDLTNPIPDAVSAILDGHLVLSRDLAQRGVYPAVDVPASVSRVMPDVVDEAAMTLATEFRRWYAVYSDARDLIEVGAYQAGSNPEIDRARELWPRFMAFLHQARDQRVTREEALERLREFMDGGNGSTAPTEPDAPAVETG